VRDRCQAGLPFGIAERGTREHQAKLLAGGLVKGRDILAGIVRGRDHDAAHALTLDQACQHLSGGPAGRIDRGDIGAEPFENPRHVDATATGIALRRRASHFAEGDHSGHRCRNVEGGIEREGDDVMRQRDFSQACPLC
jgi:hypothetical protein